MDIKTRIDELRIKKGWSLPKLAKESGIAESTAYNWFRKDCFSPSGKTIEAICTALQISITEFFSGVDDNPNITNPQTLIGVSHTEMQLIAEFRKSKRSAHKFLIDLDEQEEK